MTDTTRADQTAATEAPGDARRREALVKIGRYTAYATPVVLASMSAQAAASPAPVSGSPPPPAPAPPPP